MDDEGVGTTGVSEGQRLGPVGGPKGWKEVPEYFGLGKYGPQDLADFKGREERLTFWKRKKVLVVGCGRMSGNRVALFPGAEVYTEEEKIEDVEFDLILVSAGDHASILELLGKLKLGGEIRIKPRDKGGFPPEIRRLLEEKGLEVHVEGNERDIAVIGSKMTLVRD